MAHKTTLKAIAEHLNLSISTVSKALADSPEISDSTKLVVKTAARQLKYRPNAMARGLKSSRTKTLGVVIPNIMHNFFAKVIVGMEEEAAKNGYSLVTCISNESLQKEKQSINMLSDVSVDAIIISLSSETQQTEELEHLNDILYFDIPLVQFDRIHENLNSHSVVINDFKGAYDSVMHLHKTGCKNIALLSILSDTSVGKKRAQGYEAAIQELGADSKIINTKLEHLEKDLSDFLEENELDGIVTTDESSAIYAMNALRLNKRAVPEDVGVIGFTDGALARNYFPALTTVKQQAEIIGKRTIQLAIESIESKTKLEPVQEVIETELVIRNSTSPVQQK
ncbi:MULTISPECIES: LacI family DNA-binding transcriptional regulator [unclassified Leeuwenhoekiella]|uniref:LacI family DNA-binding transcriptional regulator n=1 Tax=unclassified Leeuwenhoekiella TaxID=2615029 RepID=UPI000C57C555|nr:MULTISPECIES: LacI family DNA-binding transcriptional regulator [unclassified Leeuwenhoekiella]MAW96432.1 LacI family transcriptional regulator [Leeuwenhoekiella sp.]MBA81319.1 LacI family transcriptional regulator [Leeuwenhoekiella sp.]|tara:strand:+ start:1162 stop:2178 length:1017 start_codon:yes stop_codon:yes gene_type:complete